MPRSTFCKIRGSALMRRGLVVEILAKALNGDIATYTLEIYKENSNNNIKEITVDGNSVTKSKTDEDTYEYTLDKNYFKETALPLLKKSAEFYLDILIENN